MADFLTRLVERTWGVAPVVKPVIAPLFSPQNLPEQTVVGLDIEENSEQIGLKYPRLNSTQKSKNISPELPAVPETEENYQSFLEVEEEFLTKSNSAKIQTFSRREEFERESKISASQSSSSGITNSQINPLSSQNQTQNLTQKDVPLIKSQNFSAVTVNHVNVNHDSRKLTRNQDNYLKSKPEIEQPENGFNSSEKPSFLPTHDRVNLLENSDVKKVSQGKSSEANFLPKSPRNKSPTHHPQEHSIQPSQKQPKSQALEQTVPPTIQVRIGRIEVRANTPPPRKNSPVRSPKPPRLSLDEYLHSNSGGIP